jgi:hypothetical protein
MTFRKTPEIQSLVRVGDFDRASKLLFESFRESWPKRFFDGACLADTPDALTTQIPEARDDAVRIADAACRGRFDLLGYRGLFFGDRVDWHLDPTSGRRIPLVHWSRLNPLDASAVGDSKVVWELNRHQWFVALGQAYRFTGNERYADAFAAYVRDWCRSNPPGMGMNWASSLEVALRLISWCWAFSLFRDSVKLRPELFVDMLREIWMHASHVERYLSYYFAPNTHLTGEALGLFYAGVLFPELRAAQRWRELGKRILVEQSERQIFQDGVYFEQSTCYQRYTIEIYLHFLILAAKNGVTIPTAVGERVQRMLDFFLWLRRPDMSVPQVGDADGGWLLPLASRRADDVRGVFSTAAVLFGRADYAWAAGGLAAETMLLLGPAASTRFESLAAAPPSTTPSRVFPHGGYVVMQSGWDREKHQLILDVGPVGGPRGGHGHADLLSVQCTAFGEPFVVDPGTFCYTADPECRDFFRSTAAHSTVLVDGTDQAGPAGPFQWRSLPHAQLRRWASTERFDFADAWHHAYRGLADPVTHRRRVVFVKSRYWVLVDDVDGTAEHRVDLRFQFGPMSIAVDSTLWARARRSSGLGLLVRPFTTVPLRPEVIEGADRPIRGWVSVDYGQRQPAPLLTYSASTRLPLRIVTLLYPVADVSASLPKVTAIAGDGAALVGLEFEDSGERVRFVGPEGVMVE